MQENINISAFNKPLFEHQLKVTCDRSGNYVGTLIYKKTLKEKRYRKNDKRDELFNENYYHVGSDKEKGIERSEKLLLLLNENFPELKKIDNDVFSEEAEKEEYENNVDYLARKIKQKAKNLHDRKKRFIKKATINEWTHYFTFTYDDKKHTEYTFRKDLKKTLSNFACRRGWKVAMKFERSPKGRLHAHGLAYIPNGKSVGYINIRRDYSMSSHKMQKAYENSFFLDKFGKNDFQRVFKQDKLKNMDYIIKYINKDNEKVFYSRGLSESIIIPFKLEYIVTQYWDNGYRYLLWREVFDEIDWYKYYLENNENDNDDETLENVS